MITQNEKGKNTMDDFVEIKDIVDVLETCIDYRLLAFGGQDGLANVLSFKSGPDEPERETFPIGGNVVRFRVRDGDDEGLEVVLTRLETGIWSAGVARLGQGQTVPSWPTSFAPEGISDFTTVIALGVPKTATVELVSDPHGS